MNPTDILKSEHRVIEQMLGCLEKIVDEACRKGRLELEPARESLDFLRTFADGCHHGKEEAHLFPAMEAKGFPRDGGPTGVMCYEHEEGRSHIRQMGAALVDAAAGDREALDSFIQNARGYIDLLREHIQKEDHCLFAMADRAFTEEDQRALLARFEQVESKDIGAGVHEHFLEVANRLADRYGVPRAAGDVAAKHGACGCHHG